MSAVLTYDTLESSIANSVPIELYEFSYVSTMLYYTSSEADVTIGPKTYLASPLARSEITESSEIGKNNVTITGPDNFPVAALFAQGPPEDIVTVRIKRVQLGALDAGDEAVIWGGRITAVGFPPQRCEITCEMVFTSLRASGIHRVYTINCPFALYGPECKVNSLLFQKTATGCVQVGNVITGSSLNAFPSGYYSGGKLVWQPVPGTYIKRGIKNHVNNGTAPGSMEITFEMPGYPSGGATLTLLPGCDHSGATCISKFNNYPNYGGFPFMTEKNPWGDASIF